MPEKYVATRESLRAIACFVLAPAYKARTGHIGLRPVGKGFGTPPFDDGSRLTVRGTALTDGRGGTIPITTLGAAAAFAGVSLSPDPGVGRDLPPVEQRVSSPSGSPSTPLSSPPAGRRPPAARSPIPIDPLP